MEAAQVPARDSLARGIAHKPLGLAPCTIRRLAGHLLPLAGVDDLLRINRILVDLLFQNLSVFSNKEIDPTRRLIFVQVNSVLACDVTTPITQERESNSNLVGEGFVGEGAVHAHTQNLGVGRLQLLQLLLEGLHLRGSTTGKGKNVES